MPFALGMIETKGLIGAIEAADAACKAANVKLISSEKVKGALINIKVIGEVAAVQSAVEAGAAAARHICASVSAHVIPNPIEDLTPYLTDTNLIVSDIQTKNVSRKISKEKSKNLNASSTSKKKTGFHNITNDNEKESIFMDSLPIDEVQDQMSLDYSNFSNSSESELLSKLELMKVHDLRKMARGIPNLGIYGREVSKANKETLIMEILKHHNKNN